MESSLKQRCINASDIERFLEFWRSHASGWRETVSAAAGCRR